MGHNRCIRHAGPKAARAYRQRQFEDMQAGKISYEEFSRSEAKRSANRLRDQWKKDPWVTGSTIELGEHEAAFQGDLLHWNGPRRLPPAILDWLRWRFRRLQIDRVQDEEWARLLRDELPRRVHSAGSPPNESRKQRSAAPPWTIAMVPVVGKRSKLDARRNGRPVGDRLVGPTTVGDVDPVEFAQIVKDSGKSLKELLARCMDDDERDQLLVALVGCVRSPGPGLAQHHWLELVQTLRAR